MPLRYVYKTALDSIQRDKGDRSPTKNMERGHTNIFPKFGGGLHIVHVAICYVKCYNCLFSSLTVPVCQYQYK